MTITSVSVIGLFTRWEAIKIVALSILMRVDYEMLNVFACRDCIEYFTVGNQFPGHPSNRLIDSDNPGAISVVWGVIAPLRKPSFILTGFVLALLARVQLFRYSYPITAYQLLPYLAGGYLVPLAIAHFFSPKVEKTDDLKVRWKACEIRDKLGYNAMVLCRSMLIMSIFILQLRLDAMMPIIPGCIRKYYSI